MIFIFHGDDRETHERFQEWRRTNPNGFHMAESSIGNFTIHYTQDKRENRVGRGCHHQGGSNNEYADDGSYTKRRKVCSSSLKELIAWAIANGFTTKGCTHCDTKQFPFPVACNVVPLSEEVSFPENLAEGAVCRVVINAYERNPVARSQCIEHYGRSCVICGFNFGAMYGPIAKEIIHVHHINPLSEIRAEHEVNPVEDLRPVCPNCHAVIHHRGGLRSIEEVRQLFEGYGKPLKH